MKNELNRAGETLKFDERANEDKYFAARDHELADAMKDDYLKNRAAQRAVEMATCPKCSGKFQKYPLLGFVLERCQSCQGIWLNKGELEGILRQQARGPLGVFLDRCFSKDKTTTSGRGEQ